MPLEVLEAPSHLELSNRLTDLSRRAVQVSVKDPQAALELTRAFEQWALAAKKTCGEWSGAFHDQALDIIKELKSGTPAPKVMEGLFRTLLQANRLLEKERKGEIEKETDAPVPRLSPKSFREDASEFNEHLAVRPEDQGLFQLFLQEAPTFLSGIQSNLLLLSSRQKADIQQVFRLFHVLIGQWGFLGFLQMRRLCQAAQGVLEPYLSGSTEPPAPLLDVLLKALGACRAQVDRIARGLAKEKVEVWDASPVLAELQSQIPVSPTAPAASATAPPPSPIAAVKEEEEGFRVRDEQMEKLLDLMGDLQACQSSLLEESSESTLKGKQATESAHLIKVTRQMRDALLSLRMSPLKPLFERLSWDLQRYSRKAGKTVYLAVESPEIAVDKALLPLLAAPLSQLIQNAVVHGIEPAEERVRLGKLPEGMLRIKASRQGGSMVLEVEDDGRGLDLERLRQKGMALGILRDEKTDSARVMEMIFKPGVTTLEGRGLGLDQVETQIEDLYGSIRVQSKAGQGCKFTVKVPSTPALVEGWVVEADGKRCLLPLSQVRKITHPAPGGEGKEDGEKEDTAPAVDLANWLGQGDGKEVPKFSVHIESGRHRLRVLVDEVHGKHQVLVRKKGKNAPAHAGVRAEAWLSDGKAVWVLDTRQLA